MLQCRDIDALMMDWLYGELDPQQAQSFSSHLEDCSRCHTELAAYERTRELVGGLPSEEPPSAVSALLIREAASRSSSAKAATASEGGGFLAWLQKFFQPLQHPALAAVATLVLVAGVAGTFWLRGDGQLAEPDVADEGPVAAADQGVAETTAAPAPTTPGDAVTGTLSDNEIDGTESADDGREIGEAKEQPALSPPPAKADESRNADLLAAKRQQAAKDLLEKSARRRARTEGKPMPKKPVIVSPNAVSGGDTLGLTSEVDKKGGAQRPEPSFEGDASQASRPYRAYRDRPDSWVSQQQLRITEAYNRRDCVTAAKIANDILDRSPELYTKSTKKLEGVKRCKAYVQKEARKRRLARQKRAKQNKAAAGKRKARSKRSAEPAPADEAVETVK